MYKDLINSKVSIIVSTRADTVFEYTGILCEENDTSIKLKNVSVNLVMLNFQKNLFGSSYGSYKQNVETVVLNKEYIISCSNS